MGIPTFKQWLAEQGIIRRKFPQLIMTGFPNAANTLKPKSKAAKLAEEFNDPWAQNQAISAQQTKPPMVAQAGTTLEEIQKESNRLARSLKVYKMPILASMKNARVHPTGPFSEIHGKAPNSLKRIHNMNDLEQRLDSLIFFYDNIDNILQNNPPELFLAMLLDFNGKINKILKRFERHTPNDVEIRDRDLKTILELDQIAAIDQQLILNKKMNNLK
jgi:hypothetical protein